MDSLYFDTFDALPDVDSPPEAETSDSFCTDHDDVPCIKCRKRKDGKLCRKCHLRIHGNSGRPSKSPLELASTSQRPDRSDSSDVTAGALDTFGLSKLTVPRQSSSTSSRVEDEKPRETSCWVTSALGQWVQYDTPQTRPRTSSIDRRCHCSRSRPCARCQNAPYQSSRRRAWEEHDPFTTKSQRDVVNVEEKVLYESTSWEFGNGYTHTHTHTHTNTHTHTHTHTKSVVRTHHREPFNPRRVEVLRPEVHLRKPQRHMAEIWSYASGRRLSRWPVEFYVMPLCGTLTWPHGCRVSLGPGSLYLDGYLSRLWTMLAAWITGKYEQLAVSTQRVLGLRDIRNQIPEELD
ncbi:hypothetical protein F4820DRAFT_445458 [Hypoxylon rubiginosum]|uniref:Uncharacterized protein n=1 Tax=Hypoxylon rubiginosum TaxID=110542 RepID=A0ACB9Z9D9_9PEZI|nr:hypothetical protein F4820DRAFT_445458 [Hypoxylon rubiginosum]